MSEKLTPELIEGLVESEEYHRMGVKTVVCLLTLQNGFELVGTSGVIDAANFDLEIGKKVARDKAVSKIWELEGYARH